MTSPDDSPLQTVLTWCADVLGPFTLDADHTREHAGQRASALHLLTPAGGCYVKMHRDKTHWENEVHAYERWAPAFGDFAPHLLAVRDVEPLALVISALPGQVLEQHPLETAQEQAVWYAAGRALAGLHNLDEGESFGPCHRDGSPARRVMTDAREYLIQELDGWLERGAGRGADAGASKRGILSAEELAIVRDVRGLINAFAGERPTPCHRDYCAYNWLVNSAGTWTGVIDFEFACWDVWATDFARDADWNWVNRPALPEALIAGYGNGRAFTAREEQQILFARALYALAAVVWGEENEYHIFAGEGRRALKVIGEKLDAIST